MKSTNNILLKTVEFLKENHLDVKDLNEEILKTVMSSDILSEQDEPIDTQGGQIIRGDDDFSDENIERLRKIRDGEDEDHMDDTPFTPKEVSIMKTLHRALNITELQHISNQTPQSYGETSAKFWEIMKLFGMYHRNDPEEDTRVSKYAKWALDNWTEAGDYGNIEHPVKVPLKWYQVDREESGSQIEYKDGTAEVLGFDKDDAGERADYDFYSWGGEMETNDYGDYESYDSEITNSEFLRMDEHIAKILKEESGELDNRTKALISIGGIQRDKVTTPKFIKNIFKSSGHEAKSSGMEPEDGEEWNTFYTPGTNIDLNSDVQRVRDRIRFEEYGEMFQQGIEGRGFAFEGMLAGLFNGEPMEAGGKEDIKIGSDYYSIKQSNPGDAWDTGSLQKGYQFAIENMVRDGFSEEEIPSTPVELMVSGEDYIQYQAQMLTESFKASNGEPLKWIFAHVLDAKHIEYDVMDSDELISAILSSDCVGEVGKSPGTRSPACAVGISRKDKTGLRIKSRFVLGDPKMITFPTVSEEDIKSIIYDPEGERVEDKIRRIFRDPMKVSQYTVDYIKNNPREFQDSVNSILPTLTTEQKYLAYTLLREESDIFGQGLLTPIEPEEFEGDEEEWDELVDDVEDENFEVEPEYSYEGGKTDPEAGFVAPSAEVTDNICKVKGFCEAQGPITFGQLKSLVEEATSKRIQADMGRGVFKTLWRIIPFFVPQILLAAVGITLTRAINKIVTPALKDTRGYKEWWGKVVLKAMDIAEGDYIPDIAMGDDPLSKVFFISDGLLQMIRDKYKLKFARYVAEVATAQPDNEPVPEWFVENLLRDYLNQKFLLSPPLPIKDKVEEEKIDESYSPLKPEEQKKVDLTPQIFQTLDDEFSIHPHPEGYLDDKGEPAALYSHSMDMFVPIEDIYQPIDNMITGGLHQEDIEMFVSIITDWLNQRTNLKTDTSINEEDESKNPFGFIEDDWKEQIINHEEQLSANEVKYKKLADDINGMTLTIPVDIHDGEEPVLGSTDITFTLINPNIFQALRANFLSTYDDDYVARGKEPTVIRYDLVFMGMEPGNLKNWRKFEGDKELDTREKLDLLLERDGYSINESLMKKYFKLYGLNIGRLGTIYDTTILKEQERDNWQEDKPFSKETHDDTKLNVPPQILWDYLDTTHRERLIKEITPTLSCIVYNCYDGWKDDPDNEWEDEEDFDLDDHAQGHCSDCGDELNAELEKVDQDLVKLGFAQEHDSEGYDDQHRKTWLEKPFPYSYHVWVDDVVKEINPRFYVDSEDNVSYKEDGLDRNQMKLLEHGADTSWGDDDDKVTLQEILELTKDIPIIPYPTKELAKMSSLKKLVSGWNPEEIERISQVEVSRQYPILVMVNEYNEVQWILDGNHRAQQAVMNDIPTIPAKLIKPSDLDERSIKIFYPDGIPEPKEDYFTGSKFGDDEGNESVDDTVIRLGNGIVIPSSHDASGIEISTNEALINKIKEEAEKGYYYEGCGEDNCGGGNGREKTFLESIGATINNKGSFDDTAVLGKYAGYTLFANLKANQDVVNKLKGIEGETVKEVLIHALTNGIATFNSEKLSIDEANHLVDLTQADGAPLDAPKDKIVEFLKNGESKMWDDYPNSNLGRYAKKATDIRRENLKNIIKDGGIAFIGDGHIEEIIRQFSGVRVLKEHEEPEVNPELEVGEVIRVLDVDGEHARMPERWGVYKVQDLKQDNATQEFYYDIVPYPDPELPDMDYMEFHKENRVRSDQYWYRHGKTLYRGDTWIYDNVDKKTISEQKESKLNPELMIGDEIMVVSTEGIHDFGEPELYKPYVVVGLKHGTTINREIHKWTHGEEDEENRWERERWERREWNGKEFDTIPYTYYQIEPIGMTDEERTGAMLAGGGRMKPMYIFPSPSEYRGSDQWILRPGFLRGEHLTESIMDDIPLEQFKEENPEVVEILDRFPEELQRELAVERKNPQEFIKDFGNYYLNSEEPIEIYVGDELNKEHTWKTIGRTPKDVVDAINDEWDADFEYDEVFDQNPDRYFEYAELPSEEAPPSLMVNGEILYGVARFVASLLRGDNTMRVWDITNKENLNEHEQPGLSPELTYGDTILVVDIDREVENNTIKYYIPSPELRPEKFTPYAVVDKESNGSESKYPFRYTLVPEDKLEEYERYEALHNNPLYQHKSGVKLLFPWVHQWIFANTPTASKVDRLTLTEHKEIITNPELQIGDEIMVINTDHYTHELGGVASYKESMNRPDTYVRYFVTKIHSGDSESLSPDGKYYGLNRPDVDVTDPERPGVYDQSSTHKYLFPTVDTWIFNPKGPTMRYEDAFEPEVYMSDEEVDELYGDDDWGADEENGRTISEHKEELNQRLTMGDVIRVVDVDKESTYEQPTYNYDTGNASGNSLMTNHRREQIHGQDTYPKPMTLYAVMSKSKYRPKDRDYLNPYWMLWPVDENYKVQSNVKKFREIILTEKDRWMTVKKHHSNIPGDIEAKQKEYDDSGRNIISRILDVRNLQEDTNQNLLFKFWKKVGPTLDKDKLKLIGFNMESDEDRGVVWDNLQEYYGDEELSNIIQDRLEGLHDSWSYEYIVTDWTMDGEGEIWVNILVNGDIQLPMTQESGGAIDMSLWDINEKSAKEGRLGYTPMEDMYEEVRSTISDDISEVLLKDLPIDMNLDYLDISEPGTFEDYVKFNKVERETITEDDDGYIDDMVYRDEPREKHTRRMAKDLGDLRGFPLDKYRNMPPPQNESSKTEEEIEYLEEIPVDKNLVDSADEISKHFTNFLSSKGLEFPKQELKEVMPGVKAIILRLKYHYNRPRPWQIAQAKGLKLNSETLESSSSPSYPSGHATQGRFVARYLADLYPEYKEEITQIGEDIAYSRNMAKVHYPSDSAFGKLLGDDMYNYVYNQPTEEETELNEYCPMGNPNRCEIVDYGKLPDTLHETVMIDDSSHPYTEDQYIDFIEYVIDELEIEESPVIKIEREATGNYTTGSYNKKTGEIKIKGTKRQLADVLRSIAHEMVHHRQNELGLIVGKIPAVGGKIEDDANMYAGQLVKSYGQQLPEIYTENTIQKVFRRTINEALEPDWSIRRGRQHYAMNQPSGSGDPVSAFNDYLVKNSPFNYMGFDYYLSAVPGRMPETAIIDVFAPMLDTGSNADKLWDATDVVYYTNEEKEVYDPNYYDEEDENYRIEEEYKRIETPRHLISYHERYGEHYRWDSFLDELEYDEKHWEHEPRDYINEPGVAYATSWLERRRDLVNDIEEIQKLFAIESTIINRDVNRPWSRIPDSYGNENIRPGKTVPRAEIRYGEVVMEGELETV